ncbi:winged helix-turn-helix domain-containing protein [Streptomyces sp. B1866]|uniref:winged helix-turn-helix domain-containing protein n=1 Tax=Streptomyces sp. B1866 TaxID=3075431 RepID=UPI00288C6819|nr:winged helix-turn-helix domain-containing protein [Streptomyces sp. B1866]MDT3395759.1 winged helix-turn-helix domain-containing protein [Streptomyces sp. B1866]
MSGVASDPRPKPVKVADVVRDRIKANKYPSGKLPTVRALAAEFGYATQTVRDGMRILIAEGRVTSEGSRGYFVARNDRESSTDKRDVSEELTEMRLQIQDLIERVTALEEGSKGSA